MSKKNYRLEVFSLSNNHLDTQDTLDNDDAIDLVDVAFSITLGLNEQITQSLNELYSLREKEYQKFLNSDEANGVKDFVSLFSVRHSKQLYQAFAIVNISSKEKNHAMLQPLFKKGFNSLYRKLINSKEFTQYEMVPFLEKTKPFMAYEEIELIAIYTTMFYITHHCKPGVVEDGFANYILATLNTFIENLYYGIVIPGESVEYKQSSPEIQETMSYITKQYTTNGRLNIQNIGNVITEKKIAEHPLMNNLLTEKKLTGKNIAEDKFNKVNKQLYKTLLLKDPTTTLILSITTLMKSYIHTEFLYGAELDKEETKKLIYLAAFAYHNDNLKENYPIETVLVIFSQLLKMQKETNHAAELYKETLTEDVENEMRRQSDKQMENLKNQLNENIDRGDKLAKEKAVLLERNKQAEQLLKDNEKELKRLHSLEAEFMRAKQENIALRNYSYQKAMEQEDKENDTIDELDMEAMLQEINAANLIIVGGNTNWQNKLKKMIPNALYMSIDKPGAFNSLSQAGKKVVINTMANTHANYYKMLKHVHTENDIYYYNNHVNTELSIQSLYNTLYNQV